MMEEEQGLVSCRTYFARKHRRIHYLFLVQFDSDDVESLCEYQSACTTAQSMVE